MKFRQVGQKRLSGESILQCIQCVINLLITLLLTVSMDTFSINTHVSRKLLLEGRGIVLTQLRAGHNLLATNVATRRTRWRSKLKERWSSSTYGIIKPRNNKERSQKYHQRNYVWVSRCALKRILLLIKETTRLWLKISGASLNYEKSSSPGDYN